MRNGFLLLMIVTIVGCDPPVKGQNVKPTVRVERQENVDGIVLTIWYDDHYRDRGQNTYSEPYARFRVSNKDELQEYKRQLEFVLSQIEEVEKRISIHEPDP